MTYANVVVETHGRVGLIGLTVRKLECAVGKIAMVRLLAKSRKAAYPVEEWES
jgi:hypothetical protein